MKSMTKLMVVAMVLVAALVVAPAAARPVSSGNTVFIGEEHVNLTKVFDKEAESTANVPGTLVYYSSTTGSGADRSGTIEKTINVDDSTDFELTAVDFGSLTGQWYAFKEGAADLTALGVADGNIIVQKPSLKLDVKLAGETDSVNGKSVTRDNNVSFEIEHNLGSLKPTVKIEVLPPGGGTLTTFGKNDVKLGSILLSGQKNKTTDVPEYSKGISLDCVESGTYTAQAKWPSSSDFYGKGYDSNTVTFEVLSKKLAISSSKDKVVRGNSFTVTVTGESKKYYMVWVKQAGNLKGNQYPQIATGQPSVSVNNITSADPNLAGVEFDKLKDLTAFASTNATIQTNAAGKRDVRIETASDTDDRQFTIRVQDPLKATTYDEVKVRVEKGTVTITASGTGVYYIGEEITLSGTNTDSDTVYLFLTGPNLNTNGVTLEDVTQKVVTTEKGSFTTETVEADDTWSYKWDTAALGASLDAGGYTVYAVSTNVSKDDLADTEYATAAVTLKSAFITASSSGATVAKGDKLTISGTAQGDPSSVYVWIFGKNYRKLGESATVESDGSFEYKLESGDTKDLSAGQYFVVVQHPMAGGSDISLSDDKYLEGPGLPDKSVDLYALQASDAATALINALDSPYVDDTYTKLTFVIEEPQIFIDPIGDKEAGSKFTISGTTNLAVGDTLIIDVTSAAFQPSKKTEASGFASASGTATVEKGDGANKWSFEIDATGFKPDQYIVKVECIETDTTQTATFNVVEAKPTTQPTGNVTTQPTTATTTATTTTAATTPTQSPGFGALVALAGLGAVAFLVLRRN